MYKLHGVVGLVTMDVVHHLGLFTVLLRHSGVVRIDKEWRNKWGIDGRAGEAGRILWGGRMAVLYMCASHAPCCILTPVLQCGKRPFAFDRVTLGPRRMFSFESEPMDEEWEPFSRCPMQHTS